MGERQVGDAVVMNVEAPFLRGGDETEQLVQRLGELAGQGHRRLVVNLSQLEHLNAPSLGALVRGSAECRRRGAHLVICCPQSELLKVFQMSRVEDFVTIRASESEALAYLSGLKQG